MPGNMNNIMKQAEDAKTDGEATKELPGKRVTSSAGGIVECNRFRKPWGNKSKDRSGGGRSG